MINISDPQKKSQFFLMLASVSFLILVGNAVPINMGSVLNYGSPINSKNSFTAPDFSKIKPAQLPESLDIQKRIEINLSRQRMSVFIDDKIIAEHIISSGKRTTATKTGKFSIISKYPVAYGIIDGITWTMPYFMGIYIASGQENGIHELPFANGWRESSRDMGYPVSHGCVRLGIGDAEKVYNFADLGTPVWVHY